MTEEQAVRTVLISGRGGVAPATIAQDDLPPASTVSYLSQVGLCGAEQSERWS